MSRHNWKKWILIAAGSLLAIALVYFLFVGYLVSGGFRNYVTFCSEYVPLLNEYRAKNLKYPDNLAEFNKPNFYPRYDVSMCGYINSGSEYSFAVREGLIGIAIYNSSNGKWFYD